MTSGAAALVQQPAGHCLSKFTATVVPNLVSLTATEHEQAQALALAASKREAMTASGDPGAEPTLVVTRMLRGRQFCSFSALDAARFALTR
jgi:hypothetical protein